jgi:hypothetical protein
LIGRIQKRTGQNPKEITQTFAECGACKHH